MTDSPANARALSSRARSSCLASFTGRILACFIASLSVLFSSPLWAAGEKLPVWKITAGQSEVILLGSVHLAFTDIYPLRSEIEDAFATADKLVVEVDIGATNTQAIQQMMLRRGFLPEGELLSDQLSEPVWLALQRYLKSRALPLEGFITMHPALVVTTLTSMRLMEMGMRPELGIDRHFLDMARDTKPILELESAQEQLDLLLSFSQLDLLMEQTLVQLDEIDLYIRPIYDAWKAGDAAALSRLLLEDELSREPRFQPIFEAVFDQRNYAMTQKIEAYLGGPGSYFVVVGAGHLVGQKGIIALLEQRGFEVRPL